MVTHAHTHTHTIETCWKYLFLSIISTSGWFDDVGPFNEALEAHGVSKNRRMSSKYLNLVFWSVPGTLETLALLSSSFLYVRIRLSHFLRRIDESYGRLRWANDETNGSGWMNHNITNANVQQKSYGCNGTDYRYESRTGPLSCFASTKS
jgi:hypothetical protein